MSESTMMRMWHDVVFKEGGNRCVLCGGTYNLESHHCGGRCELLKFNPRFGVVVCGNRAKTPCHRIIETDAGKESLIEIKGMEWWTELQRLKHLDFRQLLVEKGMSRDEFFKDQERELREVIGGQNE